MGWNYSAKLHHSFNRLVANAESETFYEAQEVSEPVFWVAFGLILFFSTVVAIINAALRRWPKLL